MPRPTGPVPNFCVENLNFAVCFCFAYARSMRGGHKVHFSYWFHVGIRWYRFIGNGLKPLGDVRRAQDHCRSDETGSFRRRLRQDSRRKFHARLQRSGTGRQTATGRRSPPASMESSAKKQRYCASDAASIVSLLRVLKRRRIHCLAGVSKQ